MSKIVSISSVQVNILETDLHPQRLQQRDAIYINFKDRATPLVRSL